MSILGGNTINITTAPASGIGVGNPVDSRAVTGSIIPDTSGVYALGSTPLAFSHIFASSGVFGGRTIITGDEIVTDFFGQVTTSLMTCQNISSTIPGTVFAAANLASSDALYASFLLDMTAVRAANSAYHFIHCISDNLGSPDPEFRVQGDGAVFSDIAASTPADYAEYFETQDPSGIDMGLGVKLNSNGLLEIAGLADKVVGFASAAPGVITDAAWGRWHNKYLKTDFGAYQLDENGDRTINPIWDPEVPYIPREDRPEWITVGVLGKIWVRMGNEVLVPGDLVKIDNNGLVTGTPSAENSWQVLASGLAYDAGRGYGTVRILYK